MPLILHAMTPIGRRHLLIALAASATSAAHASDRTVRGSGHAATERRAVTGFDRIAVAGPFEVELRQGTKEGIELSADDNLLALIETRVEGADGAATLQIGFRNDLSIDTSAPLRIRVDLIRLSSIELGGSGSVTGKGLHAARLGISIGGAGKVELPGLDADRLAVRIGGSGRVGADGRAAELALSIGGSGHCALAQLAVGDATIDISGSGGADVNVSRQLRVAIAGSGEVRHRGAAVPTVSISGSGSVRPG